MSRSAIPLAAPLLVAAALALAGPSSRAIAGPATVTEVAIAVLGDGRYRIDTTIRHDDTGWDHYADRWDVLAPDGSLLGSRELAHPHVDEQPFTRSLTLEIPAGIERVIVVANDSVHGAEGNRFEVEVPRQTNIANSTPPRISR